MSGMIKHMRSISTFSLRNNLAEYLEEVGKNENPIIVSRFGKPIAVISPYKKEAVTPSRGFFGFMGKGLNGEKYLEKIRRSKKEGKAVKALRSR